jgi:hypothetical protein
MKGSGVRGTPVSGSCSIKADRPARSALLNTKQGRDEGVRNRFTLARRANNKQAIACRSRLLRLGVRHRHFVNWLSTAVTPARRRQSLRECILSGVNVLRSPELSAAWSLIERRLQGISNSALVSSSSSSSVDVAVFAVNNAPALINQAALEPPSPLWRPVDSDRTRSACRDVIFLTSARSRRNEAVSL